MKDIIIKVNTKTSVASKDDYYIGTQGQNLQNKLIFEMSEKVQGIAWLEYEIDGNKTYALMNDIENGYEIDIKSCLLISDSVNVNLRITEEENPTGIPVFVSTISNFKVNPSISATDEEPEQYPSWLEIANSKIIEIDEKIEEVDNIYIDVSKSGKTTTVEITKKDGIQKCEDIRDGYDLDYRWNGTKLGVKREDEQEYQETDLQGPEGHQGIQGEPGYTPVKYVDYFTEEEQEEFKDEIVNGANSEFNRNVTEKTTTFNQNATTKTNEFNSNATSKTNTFNENATSKTTNFNTNATNKTTDYNTNASAKLETYNTNHTNKLNAYNDNASTKTSEFDSHVTSKTTEFDNNAASKTTDFNTNATSKTNEFNDNAQIKTDEFNANKEELQKKLDYYKTVINALPKVEEEGTDITLNDTADSPLSLGFKASESTQDLEPSPLNPQNVHTIKGNNEIIVRNKNWINNNDLDYINSNISSSYNQLSTIPTGIRYKTTYPDGYPNVKFKVFDATPFRGKTVKLKSTFTAGGTISIIRMNEDCTDSSNEVSSSVSNTTLSYVIPNDLGDKNYIGFRLMCNVSTSNDVYFTNLIMTVDSDIEPYVPYLQQSYQLTLDTLEICKILTYTDEFFKNVLECEYYDSNLEYGKWYLNKNIMKRNVDLNDRYFNFNTGYTNLNAFEFTKYPDDLKYGNITFNLIVFTNKFKYSSRSGLSYDSPLLINKIYDSANSRYMLGLPKNIDTKESAIEYIGTLDMYYILKNPTKPLLSDTLQEQLDNISYAMAHQDQTNISQNNEDRPFVISASTVLDLKTLVSRVAVLESEV